MKVEAVLAELEVLKRLLLKLEGEEISGFALIIPPNGIATKYVSIDSDADEKTFYKSISERMVAGLALREAGNRR